MDMDAIRDIIMSLVARNCGYITGKDTTAINGNVGVYTCLIIYRTQPTNSYQVLKRNMQPGTL